MVRPHTVDIPGYYFDPEKQKFFKIQERAAPTSAYSSADVKRRKIQEGVVQEREAATVKAKGRIRKSEITRKPLAGGLLERAHARQNDLDYPQIYAGGLIEQGCLSSLPQFSIYHYPVFDVEHRTDLGNGVVDVRMVFDDQIWTVRTNVDKYNGSDDHGAVQICHEYAASQMHQASWRLERFGHPGAATSLSTHLETRTSAFTWLSGVNHSGIAILPMSGIPIDAEADRPQILLATGGHEEVNMWTSTAAPSSSQDLFAFGTSDGIVVVDKERCDPRPVCPTKKSFRRDGPKDILALEYLSNNPAVLLSGSRNQLLNIIDTRLPWFTSASDTIMHPSSVTHIKQLDSHRILVAGLKSTMNQYDLRFRKLDTPADSRHYRYNPTKRPEEKYTRPILTYPHYRNDATVRVGLDVDLESGIIAAGQEGDGVNTALVELFSLHGGQKLKSRVADRCMDLYGEDGVLKRASKCVKWIEDGDGKGKSLWVGVGNNVKRFAWGTWEDGKDDFDG